MNKQEIEKAIEIIASDKKAFESVNHGGFTNKIKAFELVISALEQQLTNGWIPVSERLPNREEYCKNDGRFIVTDGSRVYQALFDIYDCKAFCNCGGKLWDLIIDTRPIAWQPLPSVWKGEING